MQKNIFAICKLVDIVLAVNWNWNLKGSYGVANVDTRQRIRSQTWKLLHITSWNWALVSVKNAPKIQYNFFFLAYSWKKKKKNSNAVSGPMKLHYRYLEVLDQILAINIPGPFTIASMWRQWYELNLVSIIYGKACYVRQTS